MAKYQERLIRLFFKLTRHEWTMIKVTKLFLKELNIIFFEKMVECSIAGYMEKNFVLIVGGYMLTFQVKEIKKQEKGLVLVEYIESRD